ncbi:MAG: chorismate synthase [Sciscionella sp.]|nr:chorismate synthase [Sciscionella sp.]
MLRWLTAGESHGPALIAVLEGMVAGVEVTSSDISTQLARRRLGFGRSPRMSFESDSLEIVGGIRHGSTQGGPVAVRIANTEWPKWEQVMAADPVDDSVLAGQARNEPLFRPRPGHADLAGMQKYGFDQARPVLERASARETAARTALGAVAMAFLRQALDVRILSHVVAIGAVAADGQRLPTPVDLDAIDADPVRAFDPLASKAMVAEVESAKSAGDTVGGIIEVLAYGLPPGLGSHVQADRRLDARLAAALMGVQSVKGVEFGDGFAQARSRGSAAHDELDRAVDSVTGVRRRTNRAGGLEGGMTNGEVLVARAALKPISSLPRALSTVDTSTGEPATAINQRSDTCAVPRAGVVLESMVALVLADAALEKFGGDSLTETRRNARGYLDELARRW